MLFTLRKNWKLYENAGVKILPVFEMKLFAVLFIVIKLQKFNLLIFYNFYTSAERMLTTMNNVYTLFIVVEDNYAIRYLTVMSDFLQKLGKQIKFFRENRGFTQETLAEKVGVAPNTIGLWENGKSFIEYPSLVKLCGALEITEEHLFSFAAVPGADSDLDKIINIIKQQSPDNQKKILETLKIFFG